MTHSTAATRDSLARRGYHPVVRNARFLVQSGLRHAVLLGVGATIGAHRASPAAYARRARREGRRRIERPALSPCVGGMEAYATWPARGVGVAEPFGLFNLRPSGGSCHGGVRDRPQTG